MGKKKNFYAVFFTLVLALPFAAFSDCVNSNRGMLEHLVDSGIIDVVLLAERGDVDAQLILGLVYDSNEIQSPRLAIPWFQKAALQGDSRAILYLAEKYFSGRGVLQNRIKAHALANIAALKGENSAYLLRDVASNAMTGNQVAKAEALAEHCLEENYDDCL